MGDNSSDNRYADIDKKLADLQRRIERVEGELGIVNVDQAGIPDKGERTDRRALDSN